MGKRGNREKGSNWRGKPAGNGGKRAQKGGNAGIARLFLRLLVVGPFATLCRRWLIFWVIKMFGMSNFNLSLPPNVTSGLGSRARLLPSTRRPRVPPRMAGILVLMCVVGEGGHFFLRQTHQTAWVWHPPPPIGPPLPQKHGYHHGHPESKGCPPVFHKIRHIQHVVYVAIAHIWAPGTAGLRFATSQTEGR